MKRIRSEEDIATILEAAGQQGSTVFTVSELVIQLGGIIPLVRLRHCLLAVPNITDLTMTLLSPVPVNLLQGITFPSLDFFKTNLPHAMLVEFLAAHPTLTTLCLDACGRGDEAACPLTAIDLRHVLGIECPTACIRGTSHSDLVRLTMHTTASVPDAPTVLSSLAPPASCASLLYLIIDVFADDYDILDRVAVVAPRLQSLKLVEKARMGVSTYCIPII